MATNKLEIKFEIEGLGELGDIVERINDLDDRELVDLSSELIADAISNLRLVRKQDADQ
jgi:hypothetical protein